MSASNPSRPPRTKSQIEADLAATRSRLTGSVESLIDTVHPNRVKQRTIANAKQVAREQLEEAKGLVFTARGDLRTKRIASVAGAVAGLVSFVLILRAIARRRQGV
ncbi:MAG TPA: DUF3618 domain-containing protein [Microlunatus sp.]|nr:DUF3618 domain-containing protein [Microlunatus sp.]